MIFTSTIVEFFNETDSLSSFGICVFRRLDETSEFDTCQLLVLSMVDFYTKRFTYLQFGGFWEIDDKFITYWNLTPCSMKLFRNGASWVTPTSSSWRTMLQVTVSNAQFQLLCKHNVEIKLSFDSANNWPVDATVTVYINGSTVSSPLIPLQPRIVEKTTQISNENEIRRLWL